MLCRSVSASSLSSLPPSLAAAFVVDLVVGRDVFGGLDVFFERDVFAGAPHPLFLNFLYVSLPVG